MKKKNIELATLVPIISGFQKIKIVDLQERYVDVGAEVIYEGRRLDLKQDTFTDIQKRANVVDIRSIKDVTIISICTAWEAKGML